MSNSISIKGDNSSELSFNKIEFENDYFNAEVVLKSDWYSCIVKFNSSKQRLIDFVKEIERLLSKELETATFINDNGNIDINFRLDKISGKLKSDGIIIRDMMDNSRLEFNLEFDYWGLQEFYSQLKNMI